MFTPSSPGGVNPFINSIYETNWKDKRYLVWGCGTGIIVQTGKEYWYENVTKRPFSKRLEIRAVTMCSESGRIASCDMICLRIHEPDPNAFSWKLSYQMELSNLNCIAWGYDGTLITSGDELSVWKFKDQQWICCWKEKLSLPIHNIIPSTFRPMFITTSEYHRIIKVWYSDTLDEPFQCSFLSHPRSALYAFWRGIDDSSLVTLCLDGFCRVWTWQNLGSFYITNVVDISGTGVWPTIPPNPNRRVIWWYNCPKGQLLLVDGVEVLVDAFILEYVDHTKLQLWAMLYDEEGNATLQTLPVLLRTFHLQDELASLDHCMMISSNDTLDIDLVWTTPKGDIYRLVFGDVNDVTEPHWTHIASGHRRPICQYICSTPYVASLAQDHTMIGFYLSEMNKEMMKPICQASQVTHLCWMDHASILLTIEESKVFAYILDEDRVTRHLISLNEHPIQRVWGASFDTESDMSTWIIIGTTDTHHLMVVMIQYDGVLVSEERVLVMMEGSVASVAWVEPHVQLAILGKDGLRIQRMASDGTIQSETCIALDGTFDQVHLETNQQGDIALAYTRGQETMVEIWQQHELTCTWQRVYQQSARVENTLLSLVWHHWQQNWILVIGYRSGVHLIAQIRDPKSAHAMIWHPICTIPISQQCGSQFFGSDMQLLRADACRLYFMSNVWQQAQWSMLSDVGTLDEAFRLFQHPLPVYHPTLLEFILYAADFEQALTIIHVMEDTVHSSDQYDKFIGMDHKVYEYLKATKTVRDCLPITKDNAQYLVKDLDQFQLPGLTESEQKRLQHLVKTASEMIDWIRGLDSVGFRFMMTVKLNSQGQQLTECGYREICWAYYSLSQDSLFTFCKTNFTMDWSTVSRLGIPIWLKDVNALRDLAMTMARERFAKSKDPTDATLFFLALRKKSLLQGLWRTAHYHSDRAKMVTFLANDFEDAKKRNAALKNAFVLLSKQRHELAAAFFLLGDRPKDAASVCIKHLKDIQLAICICRIYEGDDGQALRSVYQTLSELSDEELNSIAGKDIYWFKSMLSFINGDRLQAMQYLMDAVSEYDDPNLYLVIDHLRMTYRLPLSPTLESTLKHRFHTLKQHAYGHLL